MAGKTKPKQKSTPKRAKVTVDYSGRRSKSASELIGNLKDRGYFDSEKPRRSLFLHPSR